MALISINVPDELLDTFKTAAFAAERTVSSQIRALMREFVAKSNPVVKLSVAQTKAQEKADREAAWRMQWKAQCIELLTNGAPSHPGEKITPQQIRSTFTHNPPALVARYEAVLREAMADLGVDR